MVIGIDASRALKKQRTGTEVHNAEIIKAMVALDTSDSYRLYSNIPPFGDMLQLGSSRLRSDNNKKVADATVGVESERARIQWRVMPWTRGWTLVRLSLEMVVNPPDILFIPAHILPIIPPKRSIVMIHDLGFDHFPKIYKWTDKIYHRYAVWYAKLFASHILTPSEFTSRDLHDRYHIPLTKITTVYHGFDPAHHRPTQPGEKSPLAGPFFFYIGRIEHKKNISRMLEAFKQFKQNTGLPHKFVLAGRPAYGYTTIEKTYNNLGSYKNDVQFLGYTSQEEATRYLRHAQAMVFTTLFEGFGIPVLEAYASGVPVITSNVTSLPEVAGDAALLVNPRNVDEIAAAMTQIAQSSDLRRQLIQKGKAQYKKFSWAKAARETLIVIEKVVKNGQKPIPHC